MVVVTVLAVSIAACTAGTSPDTTPQPTVSTAWSADWRTSVCGAVSHLRDARDAFAALGDAGGTADFDRAMESAKSAATNALVASTQLEAAGVWGPGRDLLNHMRNAAAHYRKAADRVKIAAPSEDVDLLGEAIVEAGRGTARFELGINAQLALGSSVSWETC